MARNSYPSLIVFPNSPLLERLTHVHPIVPLLLWGPVVAVLGVRSVSVLGFGIGVTAAWLLAGFAVWTLTEYLLHRFVFHWVGESAWSQRLHFLIHGLHHDDPVDPTRLVMPPAAGIILAAVLYAFFSLTFTLVLGSAAAVQPFFAGFLLGYLAYDYIHYAVHHFTPRTRLGEFLKRSHMRHHFVSHDARWGVSSPLWDWVFGTLQAPKAGETRAPRRPIPSASSSSSSSPVA